MKSDRCGCGGKAILTDYTVEGAAKQYSVACETCFMGLPYGFDTPDDAWAAWRIAMGGPQPDPITGLVPCGCGGKAIMLCDLEYAVACEKCLINLPYAFDTKELARQAWNAAMGYTDPPRPGAIGPETGEMAPNGDEGVEL